jgi:hypothetical protein
MERAGHQICPEDHGWREGSSSLELERERSGVTGEMETRRMSERERCASDFLREKTTIEYVDTKEPHHLSDGEACVRTPGA